jgi:Ca2+-transporting ATPase
MQSQIFLTQIATLFFAGFPLSIVIIKKFSQIFTRADTRFSNVSTICTDVAGTILKPNLEVHDLYFNNYKAEVNEKNHLIKIEDQISKQEILTDAPFLKDDASIQYSAIVSHLCHYEKLAVTEKTIKAFLKLCGFDKEKIFRDYEIIQTIETNEIKKISTTVAKNKETQEIFSFCKGNPKELLKRCQRILLDGKKIDFDKNAKLRIFNKIKKLNKRGEKLIAFAYKGLPIKQLDNYTDSFTENDLVFLGFIGLNYPLNEDVKNQIQEAKSLGLKIYILANSQSKKAIYGGISAGIINQNYFEVLSADDIKDISQEKLSKLLSNKEKDFIFTEINKQAEEKILEALKSNNETIALITKENDITFSTIVKSIITSKSAKTNQTKMLYHSLSIKTAEFIAVLSMMILQIPFLLSIPILLTIELLINLPLELALRADTKISNTSQNFKRPLFTGAIIGAVLIFIYLFDFLSFGIDISSLKNLSSDAISSASTMIFATICLIQIFNVYHFRSTKGSIINFLTLKNPFLLIVSAMCLLIFYFILYSPISREYLALIDLPITKWQQIFFFLALIIIASEGFKFYIRKYKIYGDTNPEDQLLENQSDPEEFKK